jgi:hypothetical protein
VVEVIEQSSVNYIGQDWTVFVWTSTRLELNINLNRLFYEKLNRLLLEK